MSQSGLKFSSSWLVVFSLVLFALTRMCYSWWPLSWPDEALFSSPAMSLVNSGKFTTPVLIGLIPDMETATLWNSPLFMILLSGVYSFTGESLFFARMLSFAFAIGVLILFFKLCFEFHLSRKITLLVLCILVFDLTFIRAANTARMDMLTLFWILFALLLLIRENKYFYTHSKEFSKFKPLIFIKLDHRSKRLLFLAGICTGLAAMSHPIAILLLPVWILFCLPRFAPTIYGLAGILTGLSFWLVYIFRYPDIFISQFSMQLKRKHDIFQLFGGDTGGAFKVFFSQYGEGKELMLLSILWLATSLILISWSLMLALPQIKKQGWQNLQIRLFAIFLVILGIVILSSEGWYALYITPFLLLVIMSQKNLNTIRNIKLASIPAYTSLFFFCMIAIVFYSREFFFWKKAEAIPVRQKQTLLISKNCHSIYLRIRPDPYFELRQTYPNKNILEFIPGKLVLPKNAQNLTNKFNKIDCFLLNDFMDWEPKLKTYLKNHATDFHKTILDNPPLEVATLWQRKNL